MDAIALTQIEYLLTIPLKDANFLRKNKRCIFFFTKRNTPRLTSFLRLAPGKVEVPPGPNCVSSSSSSSWAAASSTLLPHHVLHDGRGDRRLLLRRRHGRARTQDQRRSNPATRPPLGRLGGGAIAGRRDGEAGGGELASLFLRTEWYGGGGGGGARGVGVFEVGVGKRVEIGGLWGLLCIYIYFLEKLGRLKLGVLLSFGLFLPRFLGGTVVAFAMCYFTCFHCFLLKNK